MTATGVLHFVARWTLLGTATVGFLGYVPYRVVRFKKWKGSGLLGTLAGWAAVWLAPTANVPYLGIGLLITVVAVGVSHAAEKMLTYDDPRIVIDEVAGVWLACAGLPRAAVPMALGFVLFRVFDVWKGPWGRSAARLPGGVGIVADDLAAGVIANIGARLLLAAGV